MANFYRSTFSGEANFYRSTFSGVANFSSSTFSEKVNFNGATFSKNANFRDTTFSQDAYFILSTFSSKTNFSNIKFKENEKKDEISIRFDNIKLENNSYMTFENINFHFFKNKFIESENSKIEIINTVINGRLDFNNVFISEINLEGSNIVGILNRINLKAYPSNSDTACILKNEELKKNNTIKALKFKAIEKDLYTEELKNKKNKTPENWTEIASLKISKISNNHGQNWFRAVLFTLGFGFLFFTLAVSSFICNIFICMIIALYILNINEKDKNSKDINIIFAIIIFTSLSIILITEQNATLKDLFSYFVITNFDPILPSKVDNVLLRDKNIFSYIFYIFGKIAIGYGIVEIVQAFRKLNSKV